MEWDKDLFIRPIKPLGHQKAAEAYEPHYVYDPTGSEGAYRAAWFPVVSDIESVGIPENCEAVVEGLAGDSTPLTVKITKQSE